uniref:non-specific serine/threonine protein kinase n=1 Tax=Gouania willdenowi TaxID=441366 RepID=A0A8C5D6X3_GOUWI
WDSGNRMTQKKCVLGSWGQLIPVKEENREVPTPSSKKRKAGEEVERERPVKRRCLDRGDRKQRKHRPKIKAKSPSPKVQSVEPQSSGSKESSSNPPVPLHDEDRILFTFSNNGESSSTSSSKTIIPLFENCINVKFKKEEFKAQYEEREVLGEGSYGAVYAGIRCSDSKHVAIKHIPKEKAAGLLCNGKSEAKSILKQVVDAALLMHNNGIFHQDIKGENVLVSPEETSLPIRIVDFGCAGFVLDQPYSEFCGTLGYEPPEVFEQTGYHAEPTTVWQIGAMLRFIFNCKYYTYNDYNFLSRECIDFMSQCQTFDPKQRPGLDKLQRHPWLQ